MFTLRTDRGITISWEQHGRADAPPLVLSHGAFSDHRTNWEFVVDRLAQEFSVYATARRGRGETDATRHHSIVDEAHDLIAVLKEIGTPVSLLGHSYGAHVALIAATEAPELVARLILYEPAWPSLASEAVLQKLRTRAEAGDWNGFCTYFFVDVLRVPAEEIDQVRQTALWQPILDDAPASLHDIAALSRLEVDLSNVEKLTMPTLLQTGSESPQELYLTDALARRIPNATVGILQDQAHEGMTTAPDQYVESVLGFLLGRAARA